jgi:hypothetical protein
MEGAAHWLARQEVCAYGLAREAVTVSVVRRRMLSEEAPTPMSNAPGSTAEPIVPP